MNDLKSYNWLLISEEQEWTPMLSFTSFHPMSVSLALVPFRLVGRGHNPKDQLQAHTISLDANKVASCTQDGYLVIAPVALLAAWLPGTGTAAVWFHVVPTPSSGEFHSLGDVE